jgi:hypothetical protein
MLSCPFAGGLDRSSRGAGRVAPERFAAKFTLVSSCEVYGAIASISVQLFVSHVLVLEGALVTVWFEQHDATARGRSHVRAPGVVALTHDASQRSIASAETSSAFAREPTRVLVVGYESTGLVQPRALKARLCFPPQRVFTPQRVPRPLRDVAQRPTPGRLDTASERDSCAGAKALRA